MEQKQTRGLVVFCDNGPRVTTIRLTESEWAQIDVLAEVAKETWQEWTNRTIKTEPRMKMTLAIRKAIRGSRVSVSSLGVVRDLPSRFLNDAEIDDMLANRFKETRVIDCGGHLVRFGFGSSPGEALRSVVLVESKMKNGIHTVFG